MSHSAPAIAPVLRQGEMTPTRAGKLHSLDQQALLGPMALRARLHSTHGGYQSPSLKKRQVEHPEHKLDDYETEHNDVHSITFQRRAGPVRRLPPSAVTKGGSRAVQAPSRRPTQIQAQAVSAPAKLAPVPPKLAESIPNPDGNTEPTQSDETSDEIHHQAPPAPPLHVVAESGAAHFTPATAMPSNFGNEFIDPLDLPTPKIDPPPPLHTRRPHTGEHIQTDPEAVVDDWADVDYLAHALSSSSLQGQGTADDPWVRVDDDGHTWQYMNSASEWALVEKEDATETPAAAGTSLDFIPPVSSPDVTALFTGASRLIMCCVDGSSGSEHVLAAVRFDLFNAARGDSILLCYFPHKPLVVSESEQRNRIALGGRVIQAASHWLTEHDVSRNAIRQEVRLASHPAKAILKLAETSQVHIIAIGCRGRSKRFTHLGSVVKDVLEHAECSVHLVH